MEAEARAILQEVISRGAEHIPASALQDLVEELYGDERPQRVVDDLIAGRREEAVRE